MKTIFYYRNGNMVCEGLDLELDSIKEDTKRLIIRGDKKISDFWVNLENIVLIEVKKE